MSSLDQTFWIGFGISTLLAAVGIYLTWRSVRRSNGKRKSSAQSALGDAIFTLAIAVMVTVPSISSIDTWSTHQIALGAAVMLLLILVGVQLGIAIERWRQQEPGAGNPQGVGTGRA